ncbi:hypothetical protein MAR_020135 [Mya arenaria]|uniref:Uncharacterized protein n=1 Tax=Mya arenaria TaxID=6604 RepID=A0ABY7EC93_MYAAR|nr:hypothetical protein MAR_020135 [Mya arenaria]
MQLLGRFLCYKFRVFNSRRTPEQAQTWS